MRKHWDEVVMRSWASIQEKLTPYENLRSQPASRGQKREPSN